MEKIIKFDSICEYNKHYGVKTEHPLVSVIDFSKVEPKMPSKMNFGFYLVMLKDVKCGDMQYGKHYYDYQEGTLVFMAPGQVAGRAPKPEELSKKECKRMKPKGHALAFHPDLIKGTALGKNINMYNFFSYQVNEALHISDCEREIVLDSFSKIAFELKQTIDKHSKTLIVSTIELFLNYCLRFYDRQFITRDNQNQGVLNKFEGLLNDYFTSDNPKNIGLPSVGYFASEFNLSSNYFGDLVKKETGKTAQEYIQTKLIDVAKERIFDTTKSVSQIAYELGFKYPQHFTRLFKQRVGYSPNDYRMLN
ncbi:helix-turn-helix domain-containing protein [Flagellimonas pelagia]|uniref:AraC family transcriptional regulator n=1 Tax=Flagellimonas pelagia TaxID=2306998 RepID=A0A3A1NQS6_9FLAO|nr:helix-turn-helix transcriptional regulator [Allomuricauda maritima]RIV46090.1 AraC family transcriptional regulator [Allomuricauda maritima]TXJ98865.1 AraC family transcriptional regulator [Allomuricauda maritima]